MLLVSVLWGGYARAQEALYDGQSYVPRAWTFLGWKGVQGNIETGAAVSGGGSALVMTPTPEAVAWGGARYCARRDGVSVDESMWTHGFLNLKLRPTEDAKDGDLPLQLGVVVVLKDGTSVRSLMVPLGPDRVSSTSPGGPWAAVSVPLQDIPFPEDTPVDAASISSIGEFVFQYTGNAVPTVPVQIAYIAIGKEPL